VVADLMGRNSRRGRFMGQDKLEPLLQNLLRTAAGHEGGRLSDGQLLERLARQNDHAAFEALLWRHGPMVLGGCRRLLRNPHDIEDAFQAAFLVLLRKANTIRTRDAVASWLHQVAYRIALKARARSARRPLDNQYLEEVPAPELPDDLVWRDLRPI